MSLSNPNTVVTEQRLKDFYDGILPYLGGSADAGFTPVGTVIPMIAETAPANYLICDGAAYNKSDYPELAAHLLSMTNHSQYEVSGDSTKFKVPDLRGEFIRMTGTNSHANQGSGANVGVHQNATQMPILYIWENGYQIGSYVGANGDDGTVYFDKAIKQSIKGMSVNCTNTWDTVATSIGTIRPTNTSVLFCIATKNIYLNPSLDYSTDEKVVGTWIDGKTLYQKTIVKPMVEFTENKAVQYEHGIQNVDKIFINNSATFFDYGYSQSGSASSSQPYVSPVNANFTSSISITWVNGTKYQLESGADRHTVTAVITFCYTKTTS